MYYDSPNLLTPEFSRWAGYPFVLAERVVFGLVLLNAFLLILGVIAGQLLVTVALCWWIKWLAIEGVRLVATHCYPTTEEKSTETESRNISDDRQTTRSHSTQTFPISIPAQRYDIATPTQFTGIAANSYERVLKTARRAQELETPSASESSYTTQDTQGESRRREEGHSVSASIPTVNPAGSEPSPPLSHASTSSDVAATLERDVAVEYDPSMLPSSSLSPLPTAADNKPPLVKVSLQSTDPSPPSSTSTSPVSEEYQEQLTSSHTETQVSSGSLALGSDSTDIDTETNAPILVRGVGGAVSSSISSSTATLSPSASIVESSTPPIGTSMATPSITTRQASDVNLESQPPPTLTISSSDLGTSSQGTDVADTGPPRPQDSFNLSAARNLLETTAIIEPPASVPADSATRITIEATAGPSSPLPGTELLTSTSTLSVSAPVTTTAKPSSTTATPTEAPAASSSSIPISDSLSGDIGRGGGSGTNNEHSSSFEGTIISDSDRTSILASTSSGGNNGARSEGAGMGVDVKGKGKEKEKKKGMRIPIQRAVKPLPRRARITDANGPPPSGTGAKGKEKEAAKGESQPSSSSEEFGDSSSAATSTSAANVGGSGVQNKGKGKGKERDVGSLTEGQSGADIMSDSKETESPSDESPSTHFNTAIPTLNPTPAVNPVFTNSSFLNVLMSNQAPVTYPITISRLSFVGPNPKPYPFVFGTQSFDLSRWVPQPAPITGPDGEGSGNSLDLGARTLGSTAAPTSSFDGGSGSIMRTREDVPKTKSVTGVVTTPKNSVFASTSSEPRAESALTSSGNTGSATLPVRPSLLGISDLRLGTGGPSTSTRVGIGHGEGIASSRAGGTSDNEDGSRMRLAVLSPEGSTSLPTTISTSVAVSNSLLPSPSSSSPSVTSFSPPAVQMATPIPALVSPTDFRTRLRYPLPSTDVQAAFPRRSAVELPTASASLLSANDALTAVAVETRVAIGNLLPSPVGRALTPRPVPPESMPLSLSLDFPSSSTTLSMPTSLPPSADSPIGINHLEALPFAGVDLRELDPSSSSSHSVIDTTSRIRTSPVATQALASSSAPSSAAIAAQERINFPARCILPSHGDSTSYTDDECCVCHETLFDGVLFDKSRVDYDVKVVEEALGLVWCRNCWKSLHRGCWDGFYLRDEELYG
ncbi:hypothetical protein AAF712_016511 [Marasmius tenuissimus]|uniref:Uncharacterized protein n=1 Tax=Marasmius tenuissimus TaxID=585030 RepID=A0ABR2Z7A1_9AGAR